MVNNKPHPLHYLEPYTGTGTRKISTDKPLFTLEDVKQNCREGNIYAITDDAGHDIATLGFDLSDVANIIFELNESHYKDSEWCKIRGNRTFPCDAYVIRQPWLCPTLNKTITIEYYIKFSINLHGKSVLVVSFHT